MNVLMNVAFGNRLTLCTLLLFLAGLAAERGEGRAIAADPEAAVQGGRDALSDGWFSPAHPWYDTENDQAKLIPIEPATPVNTNWLQNLGNWLQGLFSWIPNFFNWLSGFSFNFFGLFSFTLLHVVVALFVIAAMSVLIFLLVKLYRKRAEEDAAKGDSAEETEAERERVESLPFEIRRPRGDLLDEARRCYERGEYNEAIVYLFSHLLVQMDKHHVIRLNKGKTNRQYLREIGRGKPLRGIVEQAMCTFEDAFFGKYRIEKAQFESSWRRLDEFHGLVKEGVPA